MCGHMLLCLWAGEFQNICKFSLNIGMFFVLATEILGSHILCVKNGHSELWFNEFEIINSKSKETTLPGQGHPPRSTAIGRTET